METDDYVTPFLGCCYIDPGILFETKVKPSMLGASTIEVSVASRLFSMMLEQTERKIKIDYATLYQGIKSKMVSDPGSYGDGFGYFRLLEELSTAVPSAANWRHYEKLIIDDYQRRQIDGVCDMVKSMQGPSISAMDKIEHLEKLLADISVSNTGYKITPIRDTIHDTISLIEQRYKLKGDLPGISTGIDGIDLHTFGMQPQTLWYIGARPSEGKSALMRQIHMHVALKCGVPCGVISLESSINEINIRNFSAETRIDSSLINRGRLDMADFNDIQRAAGLFFDLGNKVLYYDKPGMELREFKGVARRMVRTNGAKVIFGDYIGLIKVPKAKTRFEEVGIVSTELKALARELKIPIVMLAQLGRDSESRRPTLADFQYSSQIEQDGDVVLMLWHYNDVDEVKDGSGKRVIETPRSAIIVGKARDGKIGDVPVRFDRSIVTFYEIEKNAQ